MSRVVRAIILALHIPFAVWALAGFSVRPEWQFWPVMWVAVLVLFRHRNGGLETRDISLVFLRGLLSAGLIAASIYTRAPGWGLLSAVVWIHALLGSYRDWFAVNRLGYIVIPLLLSIPVQFDGYGDFAKRLQSDSLQHAHWMLDQQGYLHYLDGEVFHVAGNRIPEGEVVLNEFSVFAMLAATAFGCVLLRRRFLHGALTLTGAVVLCYLMLVCQHAAPVVAWLDYGFDPANSRFLLHLLVFVCSLVSAISLDFLLSMFLEPVPFMESEGVNPFCVLWNRFFLVTNRAMPGADDEKPRLRVRFPGLSPYSEAWSPGYESLSSVGLRQGTHTRVLLVFRFLLSRALPVRGSLIPGWMSESRKAMKMHLGVRLKVKRSQRPISCWIASCDPTAAVAHFVCGS